MGNIKSHVLKNLMGIERQRGKKDEDMGYIKSHVLKNFMHFDVCKKKTLIERIIKIYEKPNIL